jgi:TolB protein
MWRNLRRPLTVAALLLALGVFPMAQSRPQAPASSAAAVPVPSKPPTFSRINLYDLQKKTSKVLSSGAGYYEAPSFIDGGKRVRFNGENKLFEMTVAGDGVTVVGPADVTFSHDRAHVDGVPWESAGNGNTPMIFDAQWGNPRQLPAPMFIHSASPDGKWLVGNCGGLVCRVTPDGSGLTRLTTAVRGDNSDYGQDGWIYFDSSRSGKSEIWRIPVAGAGENDTLAEQVTHEPGTNRFPHISPDGKWLLFFNYSVPTAGRVHVVPGSIRLLAMAGREQTSMEVLSLVGGIGTIARNPWSPDSQQFLYASYEGP